MFSTAAAVVGCWALVSILASVAAPTTRDAAAASASTTAPTPATSYAWVMRSAVVRSGKGAVYAPLAELKRGERLTVVGPNLGPRQWLEVEVNGVRGWVYADSLYDRPVDRRTGLELMSRLAYEAALQRIIAALVGREEFGAKRVCRFGTDLILEFSVAGRGWDAARYQSARQLETAGLRSMRDQKQRITAERLNVFMSDGRVGPAASDPSRADLN